MIKPRNIASFEILLCFLHVVIQTKNGYHDLLHLVCVKFT